MWLLIGCRWHVARQGIAVNPLNRVHLAASTIAALMTRRVELMLFGDY